MIAQWRGHLSENTADSYRIFFWLLPRYARVPPRPALERGETVVVSMRSSMAD
jgi:hypothetical protein